MVLFFYIYFKANLHNTLNNSQLKAHKTQLNIMIYRLKLSIY